MIKRAIRREGELMGTKGWIIFSVVTVVLLGGLIYFSGQNRIDVSGFDLEKPISANETNGQIGDNVFGKKDSKVVLIEYGDFQCPGCAGAHPTIKKITEKYEDSVTFVFRNLPMPSLHPHARAAAAVSEAAGKQGKYWDMHNMLYEKQNEWSGASSSERATVFEGYARTLGLDIETFKEDIASESVTQKINFDLAIAKAKDYKATPSFSLNGTTLSSDVWGDEEKLEQALKDELEKAGIDVDEE